MSIRRMADNLLPKLMLAPSMALIFVFIYLFMAWTFTVSLTPSTLMPVYKWAGFLSYEKLWSSLNWIVSVKNLGIFASLYIGLSITIGLGLAILLDQKIRAEGYLRAIFLYPMALSFIVTGRAWRWILNPELGIQRQVREWGWSSFDFAWMGDPKMAIYTVVIAAVWQTSGFAMALFLAGLRGIDDGIVKAAQVEGASSWRIYWSIVIPMLGPVFVTCLVILGHNAIRMYDLVIALTSAGPAMQSSLPATFMYDYTYARNQLSVGSASAVMMLMMVIAIIVPYLYSEFRAKNSGGKT